MKITWNSFLARRNISLDDLAKAYGLTYSQLCSYFTQRGASVPPRNHPEVTYIYGEESTPEAKPSAPPSAPEPVPAPKKQKKLEASIKNTKKELLSLASKLGVQEVNERMTKSKILDFLKGTGKVRVAKVKTGNKK